jgi:hypothetical protein
VESLLVVLLAAATALLRLLRQVAEAGRLVVVARRDVQTLLEPHVPVRVVAEQLVEVGELQLVEVPLLSVVAQVQVSMGSLCLRVRFGLRKLPEVDVVAARILCLLVQDLLWQPSVR